MEAPGRREEAAILVRVAVADHHLLRVTPRREVLAICRLREEALEDRRRGAEIRDRLEERDDVDASRHARVAREQEHLEHVARAARHADHVAVDGRGTELFLRAADEAQELDRLVRRDREVQPLWGQRPARGELAREDRDTVCLAERPVVGYVAPGGEDLGDGGLVARGVLPDVECREVEPERADLRDERAELAPRESRPTMPAQAVAHEHEVAQQLIRARVRSAWQRPRATDLRVGLHALERDAEPLVDDHHLPAIRLLGKALACALDLAWKERRVVAHARLEVGADAQALGAAQVPVHPLDRAPVEPEDRALLLEKRRSRDLRRDERVAVAVAADPAPEP